MQSVSKRAGRAAAALAVSTILIAEGAFASAQQVNRGGFLDKLLRAKQIIVKILSDIGLPPG
jgi:hypothetical protein